MSTMRLAKPSLPAVAAPLAAAGTALAACVADSIANPYAGRGIPCPFHALTGLWCPGCGSSRALYSLCHANPGQAFRENPLAMIALPYLVWRWASWLASAQGGSALWELPRSRWVSVAVGVVLVSFGIARNLPWAPFRLLGPQ